MFEHAFVLTRRTDVRAHLFVVSERRGTIMVYDADGANGLPFEEWDPAGALRVSHDDGVTNMTPIDRERSRHSA